MFIARKEEVEYIVSYPDAVDETDSKEEALPALSTKTYVVTAKLLHKKKRQVKSILGQADMLIANEMKEKEKDASSLSGKAKRLILELHSYRSRRSRYRHR